MPPPMVPLPGVPVPGVPVPWRARRSSRTRRAAVAGAGIVPMCPIAHSKTLVCQGGAQKADGLSDGIALGFGIAGIYPDHHALHGTDAGIEVARIVVPLSIGEIELAGIGVLAEFADDQAHLGQAIERNPLRDGFIAQVAAGTRRAVDRDHQGAQTQRDNHQRHQDLDQGEATCTRRIRAPAVARLMCFFPLGWSSRA